MTSEDISKIGKETIEITENTPKVKIPVAEYRNLIEAVAQLRLIADSEHSAYMREWNKANKLEDEVVLYKAFTESERDIRERFYEFKQDKAREV